jgi:hypothetical protein
MSAGKKAWGSTWNLKWKRQSPGSKQIRKPALLYKREFRFFRVRRFPFVVYYAELIDAIWVVAIAHGRRRPNYWRKRRRE